MHRSVERFKSSPDARLEATSPVLLVAFQSSFEVLLNPPERDERLFHGVGTLMILSRKPFQGGPVEKYETGF